MAVVAGAFAAPASAEVLVSNIDQTASSTTKARNDVRAAQAFTTGSNSTGYTVKRIEVNFGTASNSAVSVRLLEGDQYGSVQATLANPSSLEAGNRNFSSPAGTKLAASRGHAGVVGSATSGTLAQANSDAMETGGVSG